MYSFSWSTSAMAFSKLRTYIGIPLVCFSRRGRLSTPIRMRLFHNLKFGAELFDRKVEGEKPFVEDGVPRREPTHPQPSVGRPAELVVQRPELNAPAFHFKRTFDQIAVGGSAAKEIERQ